MKRDTDGALDDNASGVRRIRPEKNQRPPDGVVKTQLMDMTDALLTRFCVLGSNKLILLRIKMAIAP